MGQPGGGIATPLNDIIIIKCDISVDNKCSDNSSAAASRSRNTPNSRQAFCAASY
jgi:hypothetical protein